MGHGTRVGSGEAEVVTRKNLIVRLQAPRFFVQKDEVVLSANVHNYLADGQDSRRRCSNCDGEAARAARSTPSRARSRCRPTASNASIGASKVGEEGLAIVRMKALTDEESDAMEMKFPCLVHGMLKTESWAAPCGPTRTGASSRRSPCRRSGASSKSRLEVRYSPTLAGAMVDALPYLADYPYGCTEQTLNRFLPTVITQKVLLEMNLEPEGDPGQAHQPQRPGNRRRPERAEAVEAIRPQPGVRRGRSCNEMVKRRRGRADRDATDRRRLGLVQRLGRTSVARTPRPSWCMACRSRSRTMWPSCPA